MKKTLIAICLLLSPCLFAAEPEVVEIVRSKAEVPLTLDLNDKTVRCFTGDYSAPSLKISIPELREYTAFRQTTRGETAPCINAGLCKMGFENEGLSPDQILNSQKPTEDVIVIITLKEILELNHNDKTCSRRLEETLASNVRGLEFKHADGTDLGALNYDLCLKMKKANR
jgi:hypothetical protein